MFEFLVKLLSSPDTIVLGTGLGLLVGGAAVAYQGIVKGKATSATTAQAIVAASCMAPVLEREISKMRGEVGEIRREVERNRNKIDEMQDILVRIEDRTRRDRIN